MVLNSKTVSLPLVAGLFPTPELLAGAAAAVGLEEVAILEDLTPRGDLSAAHSKPGITKSATMRMRKVLLLLMADNLL
jgi:hypothetical protein